MRPASRHTQVNRPRRRLLQWVASSVALIASSHTVVAQAPKRAVGTIGEALDAVVQADAANKLWGVVYAVQKGKPVYLWVRGKNHDDDASISAESYFDFGDTSRVFTAVAVLRLVGKRKFALDDTLAKLLGDIDGGVPQDKGGITLLQLLHHTAGLPLGIVFDTAAHSDGEATAKQILAAPLAFPAGTKQQESPANDQLLAWILEHTTGKSFESVIKREVFARAGMKSSGFRGEGGFDADRQTSRIQKRRSEPVSDSAWNWVVHGWAGVISTPQDVARFALALDGTRLLNKKLAPVFMTPPMNGTLASGFELETAPNGNAVYRNATNMDGVSTELTWIPEQDLVLVLCGRDGAPLPTLGTALRAAVCAPLAASGRTGRGRRGSGSTKAQDKGLSAFTVPGVWRLPGGEHVDVMPQGDDRMILTALGPVIGHVFAHGEVPAAGRAEELRQAAMTSDAVMVHAIRAALSNEDPTIDGSTLFGSLFAPKTLDRSVRSALGALRRANKDPGQLVSWELQGIDLLSTPRRVAYALRSAPEEAITHWVVELTDGPLASRRGRLWASASMETKSPFTLEFTASEGGPGGLKRYTCTAGSTPIEFAVLPSRGKSAPQLALRLGSASPQQFIPVRTGR